MDVLAVGRAGRGADGTGPDAIVKLGLAGSGSVVARESANGATGGRTGPVG
jgi:hypothetical protein